MWSGRRISFLLAVLAVGAAISSSAGAATILQAFWWDCNNESAYTPDKNYRYEWYNYIRAQLPRLEQIGVTALWTPPPCKGANPYASMGYDIYDHYDLGEKSKNQPPAKPDGRTCFGTRDELLRFVASAHAHGIDIYPDIVLNHMSGGSEDPGSPKSDANGHRTDDKWKKFRYAAAGGPEAGRWPKGRWNFHPNPDHDSINTGDWDSEMWGPDICYASNRDADGNPSPGYMIKQAGNWFEWFSNVTGVDGFRFDAVRHYEPEVVRELLTREAKVRGRKPFSVVEYGTWDTADLERYIKATDGVTRTFDFPLHDQLFKMVFARGLYNLGSLPDFLQKDGAHSVPFVNSHDTVRGAAGNHQTIPVGDPWAGIAYAFILSLDRVPLVYYEDLFPNRSPQQRRFGNPVTRPMRDWLADLIRIRERYASGPEPAIYPLRSDDLLVIERPRKMITILNDNGADWKEVSFTTQFGPGVELKDITGQTDGKIKTDSAGRISYWLPPVSYAILVKASEPPLAAFKRTPRRTTQKIEFADDLSTGTLRADEVRTFKIWPAPGSCISAELTLSTPAPADVQLINPNGEPCRTTKRFDGRNGEWTAGLQGWHTFKVKLTKGQPTRGFLRMDYLGTK